MPGKSFFSHANLDEYRNDPKIVNAMRGAALLNHQEFVEWYSQPDIRSSRRNSGKRNVAYDNETIKKIYKDSLKQIANQVCENKIDAQYGISAILNLNFDKFDLLVAVAPHYDRLKRDENTVTSKTSLKNKTKHILGFIIVEEGECKKFHDFYAVNLICARSNVEYKKYGKNASLNRERVRGAILLGAYMFCAKKIKQDLGLLELADGYKNIGGFFSYSKMGFVQDISLFGRNCFKDFANLPMSVEIRRYTYDQIINYASGVEKLKDIDDVTGLIKLVPKNPRQEAIQKKIAGICNLTYQIDFLLNGDYTLHPKFDKEEIEFLEEFETDFLTKDEYDDVSIDDYLQHFEYSIGELSKEFHDESTSKSKSRSRSRTRSATRAITAGSNRTRKY
jgi:hypothetical protein